MTVTIRPAHPTERAALIELQRRASLANPGDRQALLDHPDAIDLPLAQIEAGDVMVGESHGRLTGFSSIYIRDDGDAELDGLFVEPDLWNTGLGRILVAEAARRARQNGGTILHVIANPHAEGFYRKTGFVRTGVFQTRFGPGLTMELKL